MMTLFSSVQTKSIICPMFRKMPTIFSHDLVYFVNWIENFQELIRTTHFSKQEIQCMYRGFKQVCIQQKILK